MNMNNHPQMLFFQILCFMMPLHGQLLMHLAAWMNILQILLLLHLKEVVLLKRQFIIIVQYTDLSVHSIWEKTLKMLWTCEGRHLEPLVAALYSRLFPSYFPDVQALDRWSCGKWCSLSGKEKKGKKKTPKVCTLSAIISIEIIACTPKLSATWHLQVD